MKNEDIHSFGKRKKSSLAYEIKPVVYIDLFLHVVLKLQEKL